MEGQIIKSLSGFYDVKSESGLIYQTRGRGNFRKRGMTPLVGDYVTFQVTNDNEGYLMALHPRKNQLVRPPVANIDLGVVIVSSQDPDFSYNLLDRFLTQLEFFNIKGCICLTKLDLQTDLTFYEEVKKSYEKIGYPVFFSNDESQVAALKKLFANKLTVFMGQSGAGKSTLLNVFSPELSLKTGEISKSLGRGRHTTRHVELFPLFDGLLADTPGFSSLEFPEEVTEELLPQLFPEFKEPSKLCKFRQCSHTNEPHCGVKPLVETGAILKSRYENYVQFLGEIKNRKPIYGKKKEFGK